MWGFYHIYRDEALADIAILNSLWYNEKIGA